MPTRLSELAGSLSFAHGVLPLLALVACSAAADHGAPQRGSAPPLPFASGPAPDTGSLAYLQGYVMEPPKNLYAIWYGGWPSGAGSTRAIVEDFLGHLGGSPYFKMNELYWDFNDARVRNSVTFAGSVAPGYSHTKTLKDVDVYYIVKDQLDAGVFPADDNGIYVVFTSSDVMESGSTGTLCTDYGGWHDHYAYGSHDIKYVLAGSPAKCPGAFSWSSQGASGPNGLEPDGLANIAAHEIVEASQDPNFDGWVNPPRSESGDLCNWTVGREGVYLSGSGSAVANMHLGDRDWLIQGNWVQTPFGGCDARIDVARPDAAHGRTTQDFNGDGYADLLWQDASTGSVSVWLMFGSLPAVKQAVATVANLWHVYGTGDVDGDGKSDVVWRNEQTGTVDVWLMDGATIKSTLRSSAAPPTLQLIGLGDVGGTGRDILFFRGNSTDPIQAPIYLDLVSGGNQPVTDSNGNRVAPPTGMLPAGTGDFDGDGKSDLLWQDAASGDLYVWYMNGVTLAAAYDTGVTAGFVRGIGDLDGDHHADVVFSQWTSNPGVLSADLHAVFFRGRGAFHAADVGTMTGTSWRVEQIADANGDGRAEIYVRDRQTGQLSLWWLNASYQLSSKVDIDTPRLQQEIQHD